MNEFLKKLADQLKDRQEFKLTVKKIGTDLIMMVVPGNGKVYDITVPGEDLTEGVDDKFFEAIRKPAEEKVEFEVKAAESEEEEEDDTTEKADTSKKETKKPESKKPAAKKQPAKKEAPVKKGKKVELENEGDDQHKKDVDEMKQDDEPVDTSKEEALEILEDVKLDNGMNHSDEANADGQNKMAEQFVSDVKAAVFNGDYDLNTTQNPPAAEEVPGVTGVSQKTVFKTFMDEGKKQMDARQYKKAEEAYQEAVNLFPENAEAKKALNNASQWVKAIERMKV